MNERVHVGVHRNQGKSVLPSIKSTRRTLVRERSNPVATGRPRDTAYSDDRDDDDESTQTEERAAHGEKRTQGAEIDMKGKEEAND